MNKNMDLTTEFNSNSNSNNSINLKYKKHSEDEIFRDASTLHTLNNSDVSQKSV